MALRDWGSACEGRNRSYPALHTSPETEGSPLNGDLISEMLALPRAAASASSALSLPGTCWCAEELLFLQPLFLALSGPSVRSGFGNKPLPSLGS